MQLVSTYTVMVWNSICKLLTNSTVTYVCMRMWCDVICSVKMMEEKLRYAAYNCIAIDTDASPTRSYDD